MKGPSTEVSEPPDAPFPWRADLVALLKVEETEHAQGFNAGIQAALELLARHEHDRQLLSRLGLKQRKIEGKKTGGDVPYGYQLAADGATLLANLDEQRVIAKVRMFRPNHSLRAIARKLKEAGIFPRNYDPRDPNTPREFQAVQIRRMLDQLDDKGSSTPKAPRKAAPKPGERIDGDT
jgi:hypothetical protein